MGHPYFIRISRSFIANIKPARKISRGAGGILVLEENSQLPIIAEKIDEVINLINSST